MKLDNVSSQSASSVSSSDVTTDEGKNKVSSEKDSFWSEKSKEDFKRVMSGKGDFDLMRDGSSKTFNSLELQGKKENDFSSMFSDFAKQAAMMTSSEGTVGVSKNDAPAPSATRAELQELVNSMVDKILVSQPRVDGAHQVMLKLNDSVLPNTTITLTRDVSGMLFVNIVSSDPVAFKKLMATKDMLEIELDNHEKNAFRVEVSFDGADVDSAYNNMQQTGQNAEDVLMEGDNENV